jgi:hypothetical protein
MPGTKSLSGSESLPEAQDLMLHTPPANRWLPEVPLPLFFSFVPPFFCPGLMNRYRFFKDLCRPLSRQFKTHGAPAPIYFLCENSKTP